MFTFIKDIMNIFFNSINENLNTVDQKNLYIEKIKEKNMNAFYIKGMEDFAFTQANNRYKPYVTCFPTSLAMAMSYALFTVGKDKSAVGCASNMQIEDYIYQTLYDSKTKQYLKKKKGRKWWGWGYSLHTIAVVNEYIFNRLMNRHGFKATFKVLSYDQYCNTIALNELPIVLMGNFKSVSRIGGHIVCGIGFNKIGIEEVIVNDPYGNALKGYPKIALNDRFAKAVTYPKRFFNKKKGKMYCIVIKKS